MVGFGEPRLSYPVFILHMLLALAAFVPPGEPYPALAGQSALSPFIPGMPTISAAIVTVAAAGILLHCSFGRARLYRGVDAQYVAIDPRQPVDSSLPRVTAADRQLFVDGSAVPSLEDGRRYRGEFALTASMWPVRYAGITIGVPADANNRRLPHYLLCYLVGDRASVVVPARFSHVAASEVLREGDRIDAEFVVAGHGTISPTDTFVDITAARVLPAAH
jgi:hypothetical protein